MDRDFAGNDIRTSRLDSSFHGWRNQAGIVFINSPVHSPFGQTKHLDTGREVTVFSIHEDFIGRPVNPLVMEVSTEPGIRPFWLESTPMASLPASAAAWIIPRPMRPAAW